MKNWFDKHPHLNPRHEPGGRQRRYVFLSKDRRNRTVFIGIEDRSRWLAHQGVAEIARRARQIAAGTLEVSRG